MRILYVSQFLARETEPSANRQWDLIKAIRDAGHDVHVVTSNRHYLLELEGSSRPAATVTETWDGIPVTLCRTASGLRRSFTRRLLSYFSFALDHPTAEGIYEIGGRDILTYREMMLRYARIRHLHRLIISFPVPKPELSSRWVDLLTPIP